MTDLKEAVEGAKAEEIKELFAPLGLDNVYSFNLLLEQLQSIKTKLAEYEKTQSADAETQKKQIAESLETLKKAGVKLEEKGDEWKSKVHSLREGDALASFVAMLQPSPTGSLRTGAGGEEDKKSGELTESERSDIKRVKEEM